MARTRCSCGGPIVVGEGWRVCSACGDTRQMQIVLRPGWRATTVEESAAREAVELAVELADELTREVFEEAP